MIKIIVVTIEIYRRHDTDDTMRKIKFMSRQLEMLSLSCLPADADYYDERKRRIILSIFYVLVLDRRQFHSSI